MAIAGDAEELVDQAGDAEDLGGRGCGTCRADPGRSDPHATGSHGPARRIRRLAAAAAAEVLGVAGLVDQLLGVAGQAAEVLGVAGLVDQLLGVAPGSRSAPTWAARGSYSN